MKEGKRKKFILHCPAAYDLSERNTLVSFI